MNKEMHDALRLPFPTKMVKKNYQKFDYIPPEHIIDRLNDVAGLEWAFFIIDISIVADEVICQGSLTIDDVSRTGIGTDTILRETRQGIKMLDPIGKAYKSAASNCLKLCARLFGVANQLWGGADMPETYANTEEPESSKTPEPETIRKQQDMVAHARELMGQLMTNKGKPATKALVFSILKNVGEYTRFDDPRMTPEDMQTICSRMTECLEDNHGMDERQTTLTGLPD